MLGLDLAKLESVTSPRLNTAVKLVFVGALYLPPIGMLSYTFTWFTMVGVLNRTETVWRRRLPLMHCCETPEQKHKAQPCLKNIRFIIDYLIIQSCLFWT
jgi:hypothetical protein